MLDSLQFTGAGSGEAAAVPDALLEVVGLSQQVGVAFELTLFL